MGIDYSKVCPIWDEGYTEEEQIAAYQYAIDTGIAWSLEGWIGRMAASLIEAGICQVTQSDGSAA